MKPVRRKHLRLEHLEDRTCPSLTITAASGNLSISGTPLAGPTSAEHLLVQEVSVNRFLVQEAIGAGPTVKTYGVFPASANIFISLAHYNTNINVDFHGLTFGGNLVMNLGLGDTDLTTVNPVSIYSGVAGGSIRGHMTVVNGSGGETIAIGQIGSSPGTPAALTVGGNVTVAGRNGGNSAALNAGNALFIGPGSTLLGDLTTSFIHGVNIGEVAVSGVLPTPLTTVNGNVNISNAGANHFLDVEDAGIVGKSMTVTGTNLGDVFTLEQTVDLLGGSIAGNLTLNLPQAGGAFGETVDLAAGTMIGGSFSSTTAGGSQTGLLGGIYTLAGTINGDATINMGEGDNTVMGMAGSTVSGSMHLSAGSGNNSITLDTTVSGNLSFAMGNGDDSVTIGNAPGGMLFWNSGNGNDSVTFGDGTNTPGVWNVFMQFGTGNDTLTLAGTGSPATPNGLTGFIDMGGPPGGNSFDPTGQVAAGNWAILSPFTLQNV
jgi:hypothetical protein